MPYVTGQDLKREILFRSGEANTGSKWDNAALDYLNRSYRTLAAGASEFLPEEVPDWWWLRRKDILTLAPIIETGTITVTQDSTSVTFSDAPAIDVDGYRLKVEGHPEIFNIAAHTAASTSATLDSAYTGQSAVGAAYKLMKTVYTLDSEVNALISPMSGYRRNARINGLTPERMDDLWPNSQLEPGIPTAFALEDTQSVRFNRGGLTTGESMRIEYRYRPVLTDLTDSPSSEPLVPLEYRHILSEMAIAQLLRDKNDQRDQSFAISARNGLQAMVRENKRRIKRMNDYTGHIFPRQGGRYGAMPGPAAPLLRTEGGLIIG